MYGNLGTGLHDRPSKLSTAACVGEQRPVMIVNGAGDGALEVQEKGCQELRVGRQGACARVREGLWDEWDLGRADSTDPQAGCV